MRQAGRKGTRPSLPRQRDLIRRFLSLHRCRHGSRSSTGTPRSSTGTPRTRGGTLSLFFFYSIII